MSSTPQFPAKRSWAVWLFLVGQPVVLAVFAYAAVSGSREFQQTWRVPPMQENPLSIRPLYDCPDVVSDEQLRRALLRLRPRLAGTKTLLADVDHALRCWGPDARFDDPEFASGADLRALLTDTRRFTELYGPDQPAAMIDTPFGVCCRVKEGIASTSHTDHTLACLAEVGTPLSYPIVTPSRQATFRAMIEQALHDFNLNQIEYEWSAKTFSLFLPPATRWDSTEGQTLSFDLLADRIMRERLPRGVCYGMHRLYGLMAYLRLDDQTPILSPGMRGRIIRFLKDANRRLVANQHADGFWNGDWFYAPPASSEPTKSAGDQLYFRIVVTGHAVEYWALAPQEIQPKRAVVIAAANWIVRTIDTISEDELRANFSFLSHAVRGLALWRGKEPFEALQALSPTAAGDCP
jgi:hypothetical protein